MRQQARTIGAVLQLFWQPLFRDMGPLRSLAGCITSTQLRSLATNSAAGGINGNTNYFTNENAWRAPRWFWRLRRLPGRVSFRLRNAEKEDWVLMLIPLGWCGFFAGVATFNSWRAATREARHPYLTDAKSVLQSDKRVTELLGAPLQVTAVEEHNETFAPWKRLVLELRGSRGNAKAFVSARRVGYSEEDLIETVVEEEDEGPLWSRPYLLKQRLLQKIDDLWQGLHQLLSPEGKGNSGGMSGTGQWEIDSLFVYSPNASSPGTEDNQGIPDVISCKGRPADNPDFHRLIPPEFSWKQLLSHWVANTCIVLVCLYSLKRIRAEWKMAAERFSSLRFVRHFITHHRHLRHLATRQLQDAIKHKRSLSTKTGVGVDNQVATPHLHMRYFTGELSSKSIDGVAHLEIEGGDDAGDDPDFTDKLQCELVRQATNRGNKTTARIAQCSSGS